MIQGIALRYAEAVQNPGKTSIRIALGSIFAFLMVFFLFLPSFAVDGDPLTGAILSTLYTVMNAAITLACLFGIVTGVHGAINHWKQKSQPMQTRGFAAAVLGIILNGAFSAIGTVMVVYQFI